jgi:hypothetical protein
MARDGCRCRDWLGRDRILLHFVVRKTVICIAGGGFVAFAPFRFPRHADLQFVQVFTIFYIL